MEKKGLKSVERGNTFWHQNATGAGCAFEAGMATGRLACRLGWREVPHVACCSGSWQHTHWGQGWRSLRQLAIAGGSHHAVVQAASRVPAGGDGRQDVTQRPSFLADRQRRRACAPMRHMMCSLSTGMLAAALFTFAQCQHFCCS